MNKTEILNIVNEPSKHIQIVKIDGKDSIVYSSKFVELLELIPTMLAKDDMMAILDKIRAEIKKDVWEDVVVSLDGTDEVRIPRLDPDDVFEIIDKYRGDSEDADN